jgi:2,4-dienoyl-CoA reductase-like NADH-dependent reductase (Old Yellow Enzyme family)
MTTLLGGAEARPTAPSRIEDLVRRFQRGDFDLVSIGRSLIGDPDWVAKMRDGHRAEIRPFRRADLEFLSALPASPVVVPTGPDWDFSVRIKGINRN